MYVCRICQFDTVSIKNYVSHARIHSNNSNLLCGIDDCNRTFKTFNAFSVHIIREHSNVRKAYSKGQYFSDADIVAVCSVVWCCQQCCGLAELIRHLKCHINTDIIAIECPIKNCVNKYDRVASFMSHLSRKHRKIMEL